MQRSRGWIIAAAMGMLSAGPAFAADLTVQVEGVLPAGGVIRLGLYDAPRYPNDANKPLVSADVPAMPGETIVTLHDVPPGVYGIQLYQDVNANGRMDTSWFGLPLEPFGFSQDATPFVSKPSFDQVKFTLAPGDNRLVIHLQNSIKSSPTEKARDAIRARQRK
jgi:uncharacterized protein (DUF2141 family)